MAREFVIYADESIQRGPYYSNFYGGVLVESSRLRFVQDELRTSMLGNNLHGEIKWSKVTENYAEKYEAVLKTFFRMVGKSDLKVRIMFTQNRNVPLGLSIDQLRNQYHLLYYQFIKHAFGFQFSNPRGNPIGVRINLDKLPDSKEKSAQFKAYLSALNRSREFRVSNLHVKEEQIAEVDSRDHDVLQCLDVILGAMQFRLNGQHMVKPEAKMQRAKRTRAKERVYKTINREIRSIYPNFNIGITTGNRGNRENRWLHPYRHWLFVSNRSIRESRDRDE